MKKLLLAVTAMVLSLGAQAQNATNSPYTGYGYGRLSDQTNGAMKAMGGIGIGWREGNQVNFSNPASYSCLDSLTFLFDAGVSLQATNFDENGHRVNANNSSFDYVLGAFRVLKCLGMAFGVMPYSTVNYDYYSNNPVDKTTTDDSEVITYTNDYYGTGGFRQVFLGLGFEPLRLKKTSLSIGVNASYLWGSYTKSIINSYSDDYVNTLSKYYTCSVNALKLDFGAQFQQRIGKNDLITIGGTFSMKQKMYGDPKCRIISTNSQTAVADTTTLVANGAHYMPMTFGAGLVWNHANKLRIGADYKMEKWADVQYPLYKVVNNRPQYNMEDKLLMDRSKFALGAEYCANEKGRKWFKTIKYRVGFSYATPYFKINGHDGPKEMGASFGFGIPITNSYNNRSVLNLSAQWLQQSASGFIKENIFCINVGLTFNERWFAKWLVE